MRCARDACAQSRHPHAVTLHLYPKFTLVFFFTGKYRKRLFVCGRGVKVELLKTLRFVLCSFQFGIHTMHGE